MQRQQFINKLTQADANTHIKPPTYFVIIGRGNKKKNKKKNDLHENPNRILQLWLLNLCARPPKTQKNHKKLGPEQTKQQKTNRNAWKQSAKKRVGNFKLLRLLSNSTQATQVWWKATQLHRGNFLEATNWHRHMDMYLYIYIIHMYICVCVLMWMQRHALFQFLIAFAYNLLLFLLPGLFWGCLTCLLSTYMCIYAHTAYKVGAPEYLGT